LKRIVESLPFLQDNILVFDGFSSVRPFASKTPDGLPEHFVGLPVTAI